MHQLKRWSINLITLLVMTLVLSVYGQTATAQTSQPQWVINGESYTFSARPTVKDNRWNVPVREIAEKLQVHFRWDAEEGQLSMYSPLRDHIVLEPDRYVMQFNGKNYITDSAPFQKNGTMYMSARQAAELFHLKMQWDRNTNTIYLDALPAEQVQAGETWATVSAKLKINEQQLKKRNPQLTEQLAEGDEMKWIIPLMMKQELTNPNLTLLAKLIYAEAGHESYNGQLAVGNVILNRVEDPRFPDTIPQVIYARGQFTPALDGTLTELEPSKQSMKAAREAMLGVEVAGDALYFYNPKRNADNPFFKSLEVVVNIGSHRFSK
ncbi:cell wall hydrolase [Marinicrinis lubricantis]|uniref:Cell wall hydrolase n=1 Tax=Marinicrinis lubricantis TaxID=2086470 RepID=A0ABW1IKE5_9BACL